MPFVQVHRKACLLMSVCVHVDVPRALIPVVSESASLFASNVRTWNPEGREISALVH